MGGAGKEVVNKAPRYLYRVVSDESQWSRKCHLHEAIKRAHELYRCSPSLKLEVERIVAGGGNHDKRRRWRSGKWTKDIHSSPSADDLAKWHPQTPDITPAVRTTLTLGAGADGVVHMHRKCDGSWVETRDDLRSFLASLRAEIDGGSRCPMRGAEADDEAQAIAACMSVINALRSQPAQRRVSAYLASVYSERTCL